MLPDDEKTMKKFFENFRGSYGLLILAEVSSGPVYCPDLRHRLRDDFGTVPGDGSLYSALDKLEGLDYVVMDLDPERDGRTCRITERGKQVVDSFYASFKKCLGSSR